MKDFAEFEVYAESDAFKADLEQLRKKMVERYDSMPEMADEQGEMKMLTVERWVDQRRPLLLLRKNHEWLNS